MPVSKQVVGRSMVRGGWGGALSAAVLVAVVGCNRGDDPPGRGADGGMIGPMEAEEAARFHVARGEWAEADVAFKAARENRERRIQEAEARAEAIRDVPEVAKTRGDAAADVELATITDVAEVRRIAEERLDKFDYDAALVAADEAVRRGPKSWEAHHLRGRALMGQGKLSAAIRAFKTATKKQEVPGHVHNALGYAFLLANEPTAALEAFDVALTKGPVTHQLLNNLGLAYEKVGRLEDAESAFVGALELKADYVKAAVNLERVEAARSEEAALAEVNDLEDPLPEEIVAAVKEGEGEAVVAEGETPVVEEKTAEPEPELIPGG